MTSVHTQLLTDDASGMLLERSFRLRVVGGPDQGKEHMLDEGTTMVGTHVDNDLVLSDATVSRYHLEIRVRRDGIEIRDLDTTNGTKHGGARVGQVVLTGAARLRLGKHTEVDVEPIDQNVELSAWPSDRFGDVLGTSGPMKQLFALLAKAAPTEATILLHGRDRHRQGSDRRGGSPGEPAREGAVHRRRLRLDPARADRVGAVRPRARAASPAPAPTSRA